MFCVVEVFLDYDYIENVKWIVSFDTRTDCEKYIEDERKIVNNNANEISEYISIYLDNIKLPDNVFREPDPDGTIRFNYQEWEKFVKEWGYRGIMSNPHKWKQQFEIFLRNSGYQPNDPNYNPPHRFHYRELFVIKIPE